MISLKNVSLVVVFSVNSFVYAMNSDKVMSQADCYAGAVDGTGHKIYKHAQKKQNIQGKSDPNEESEVGPEKQLRAMLLRVKAYQERHDTKIITESAPSRKSFGRGCDTNAKL